jgi:hypothetical protein
MSSGMLRLVTLVRTDVSEELIASFIRVSRFGVLGTTLAVNSNRRKLRRNTLGISSQRASVANYIYPDEGGAKLLRNDGSYKSHTA